MSQADYEAVLSYKGHQIKASGKLYRRASGKPYLSLLNIRVANKAMVVHGPWDSHDQVLAVILENAKTLIDDGVRCGQ